MKKAVGQERRGAGEVGRIRQSMWLQRSWCWLTKTLIRGARRYEKRRVWCKARESDQKVLMLWFSVKCKSSGGVFNSCWPINAHNSVILKTPCTHEFGSGRAALDFFLVLPLHFRMTVPGNHFHLICVYKKVFVQVSTLLLFSYNFFSALPTKARILCLDSL